VICRVLSERPLTCLEDMVGFFLQIIIVSLCLLVLLMRMVRDRKRALGRGQSVIKKGGSLQNGGNLAEDEVQVLPRGDDDEARV